MFDEYCDYCHKPIKKSDFLVHLRYLTFSGIRNEYYHKRCYEKLQKEYTDNIREAAKRILDRNNEND